MDCDICGGNCKERFLIAIKDSIETVISIGTLTHVYAIKKMDYKKASDLLDEVFRICQTLHEEHNVISTFDAVTGDIYFKNLDGLH